MQLFVVVPKSDSSFPDPSDTTLRNGRTSYIASGVLQEMTSVLERLNLDSPRAFLLRGEHIFHLLNRHFRVKLTRSQGCAEEFDYGLAPRLHQLVTVIVDARHPVVVGRSTQSSTGHHCVYV